MYDLAVYMLSLSLLSPLVEDDGDVDRVLLSYGFGTSVPSSSRRRMQQRYETMTTPTLNIHMTTPTYLLNLHVPYYL